MDQAIPPPTLLGSAGPVAPDGDTIMAMEIITSEKPITIFPVFIICVSLVCGFFMGR
jgi:hypothetical protein